MDRQEEEEAAAASGNSSSSWGLGKLGSFFKRLTSETPMTEEELAPVIETLKKKVCDDDDDDDDNDNDDNDG